MPAILGVSDAGRWAWRELRNVMPTMHFGDVVRKDDVAPFLAVNQPSK